MVGSFVKTYADRAYRFTTMVRHKGTLIAFALDDQRQIVYAVLDMSPPPTNTPNAASPSPLDVTHWPAAPQPLIFANEIAAVGFGVTDQTLLPVYRRGSPTPEKPGAGLPVDAQDRFRSTTARFSADAPFQVLSDNQYVYVFRQALADPADPANADLYGDAAAQQAAQLGMVYTDAVGHLVTARPGTPPSLGYVDVTGTWQPVDPAGVAPLVNGSLLVDRFVLTGTMLQPKLEVRFQRSRSKTRPQSRKDSLGAQDLDGNPFYEPTQELKFIRDLGAGRFCVLLAPTQVADLFRWYIFTVNRRSGLIDAYNVERSADGLFNTRGSQAYTCVDHPSVYSLQAGQCTEPSLADPTQPCGKPLVPRTITDGHAESALQFANPGDYLGVANPPQLGGQFTLEGWIKPAGGGSATAPLALLTGDANTTLAAERSNPNAGPGLWILGGSRLLVGFGDGARWLETTTQGLLAPDSWNHFAVTFDGNALRFFINGRLRAKTDKLTAYVQGKLQTAPDATGAQQPQLLPATRGNAPAAPVAAIGATQDSFAGVIDELRIWNRPRTDHELQADLNQRLTGFEPGLLAYWHFDEGSGDTAYDETDQRADATLHGPAWVTSDAPVGENPGLSRTSFRIAGRSLASGLAALLYYQQAPAASGYTGDAKPIKQAARLMLAAATSGATAGASPANNGNAAPTKNYIAVLDFGVSTSGRIAEAPAVLSLDLRNPSLPPAAGDLNAQLDAIAAAEDQVRELREAQINAARDQQAAQATLAALQAQMAQATVTIFRGTGYVGVARTYGPGDVDYADLNSGHAGEPDQLGFNDQVVSIKIADSLQVTAFEDAGFQGHSIVFTQSTSDVGDPWRTLISALRIEQSPQFSARLSAANQRLKQLNAAVTDLAAQLQTARQALAALTAPITSGAEATLKLVYVDPFGLTISGGLLGFAWSADTPVLFDSANGSVAMYFRGTDSQFFVTYYNTLTIRARYTLTDGNGGDALVCEARTDDVDSDEFTLTVSPSADGDDNYCTLTIDGAGIEETWNRLPRNPQRMADVLNAAVPLREFLGSGSLVVELGQLRSLRITQPTPAFATHPLPIGTTLVVGDVKVQITGPVQDTGPGRLIPVKLAGSGPALLPLHTLPIYYLAYDYAALAQTTKVPNDLYNGSLLVRVRPQDVTGTQPVALNQRSAGATTAACKWTAAAPGSTLAFDGVANQASLPAGQSLTATGVTGDLTLEAWVRPNQAVSRARLIQQTGDHSSYLLGLERHDLLSALQFDGAAHVDLGPGVVLSAPFTQELWVYPAATNQTQGLLGGQGIGGPETRSPSLWVTGASLSGGYGDGARWLAFATPDILAPETWNHVAVTFDGAAYRVYVNGLPRYETTTAITPDGAPTLPFAGHAVLATPIRTIGCVDTNFTGRLDDVRLWKRARTQAEIFTDMNRRLGGNETDLVGYWHFEGGQAQDYARNHWRTTLTGNLQPVATPLPSYVVFAGVKGMAVRSRTPFPGGSWTHLAAVFTQSSGVSCDGQTTYLNCGGDESLDLGADLTIEAFVTLADFSQWHGIAGRGSLDADQNVPYSLAVDLNGYLTFSFNDVDGVAHSFRSRTALTAGTPHSVAVTRKRSSLSFVVNGQFCSYEWHDIRFYIDGATAGYIDDAQGGLNPESSQNRYAEDTAPVLAALQYAPHANEKSDQAANLANAMLAQSHGQTNQRPREIAHNTRATEVGRVRSQGQAFYLKGTLTEARTWNVARDAQDIGKEIKDQPKGLAAWWRFKERTGKLVNDSAGQNHATINGVFAWVDDPDPTRSHLSLYVDDSDALPVDPVDTAQYAGSQPQLTLGALRTADGFAEYFQGELEEVRIWSIARTQEQVQDNLFRRLVGDEDNLLAYYTFDPDPQQGAGVLVDQSGRGSNLAVNGATLVLSTAPVGDDAPQVRSALAGVRTTFNDLIDAAPAVQEYGDLQTDAQGNLVGVLERCYASIKNNQWQLITGFKVGDLVTEWIGQMQFAPQLIGFIEGAPPVPSENLTVPDAGYSGASSVEIVQAQTATFTYAASKDTGFDLSVDAALKFGFKSKSETGAAAIAFVASTVEESDLAVGLRATFENTLSWLESATTSVGQTTTGSTQMVLRGSQQPPDPAGAGNATGRFVPDNVGLALVRSETADIYALRLKQNQRLVSFQMRANPDIPPDRNIIIFPLNPRYVKQGSLDGKIGLKPDVDYPNALTYSADSSYFKPIEAYALKNRIDRTQVELQTYYDQYAAGAIGRRQSGPDFTTGRVLSQLPQLLKRNLVNTYVWTADGGLFAETEETMDTQQETLGGSYAFKGMGGLSFALDLAIVKARGELELEALFGGHLNLSVEKTTETDNSFALNVDLGGLESDLTLRDANGDIVWDRTDPQRPKPRRQPGKVDAYRFFTFYLEPSSDAFDLFFNRIVDPIWLAGSEPGAVALREARQTGKKPACWRVLHRVTYVSRVLPPFSDPAAPALEKTLQTLDIDSNYELIKLLDPFVSGHLTSFADLSIAVRSALQARLPQLLPHADQVIHYLSLYYGLVDIQQAAALDMPGSPAPEQRLLNQPPIVNAGADQTVGLDDDQVIVDLAGTAVDDRLDDPAALFVTWSSVGGDLLLYFDDPHALATKVHFTRRGRFSLQLSAGDGMSTAFAQMTVTVNQPPVVNAGPDQEVRPRNTAALLAQLTPTDPPALKKWLADQVLAQPSLSVARLHGVLVDDGLGDPTQRDKVVKVQWSQASPKGTAHFSDPAALDTLVTFDQGGHYLLRLTVDNGSFVTSDELVLAVGARVTHQLQALYTFKENGGAVVHDVSGSDTPLDLAIADPTAVAWQPGGLALTKPTVLATAAGAGRITDAIRTSGEITVEAWVLPAQAGHVGLARIVNLGGGPNARNFVLGQAGNTYCFGLRTSATLPLPTFDGNASTKMLAAGSIASDGVPHQVVCTRSQSGLAALYVDGAFVASRQVSGDFARWDSAFRLTLGQEPPPLDGHPERAWLGAYHLVAIYSRAQDADEVRQNYLVTADANLPPSVSAGPDQEVNQAALPAGAVLNGRVTDDRPSQVTTHWRVVSGPPGATIADETALHTAVTFARKGRYVLRLTADDGELFSSADVTCTVNRAPDIAVAVTGATNGSLPATYRGVLGLTGPSVTAGLSGIITDDGLGNPPGTITVQWQRIVGPRSAQIDHPDQLNTPVRFVERGVYQFQLTVSNGRLTTTSQPVIFTVNQAPVIEAGPAQTVLLPPPGPGGTQAPVQVTLNGAISDNGLGDPQQPMSVLWEQLDGHGAPTPLANQLRTAVNVIAGGAYRLRLTVSNPSFTVSDEFALTVNRAPVVDAGLDQTVTFPAGVQLEGTVTDDGLPDPPGVLNLFWSKVSGPGFVVFLDVHAAYTTVTFTSPGVYVLRLTANDGHTAVADDVKITVNTRA